MITHDPRWSLPRGNTLVPSRWQATAGHVQSPRMLSVSRSFRAWTPIPVLIHNKPTGSRVLTMTIAATPVPLSEAKARLSEVARRVRQQRERIVLTRNGEPEVVCCRWMTLRAWR
jgi:Antitoxin Phd_YefM, type II toxin-antitoxin system